MVDDKVQVVITDMRLSRYSTKGDIYTDIWVNNPDTWARLSKKALAEPGSMERLGKELAKVIEEFD
jgi:hypothetical protein